MRSLFIRFILPSLVAILVVGCGGSQSPVTVNKQNNDPQTPVAVTTFQPATVVIGQKTFSSYSSSNNRPVAAYTNDGTYGSPLVHDGILYVPDTFANRVLGYNTIPATSGANADFVLGQNDFTSSGFGTTASKLSSPQSVRYANGKFFVLDYDNSRVLIWNTPPTTTGVPADIVVGQPNFTSNNCLTTDAGLCNPEDIFVTDTNKLIVADSGNNRVLIWNSIPATNGVPADVVLGQANFTRSTDNDDDQDGSADIKPSNRTFSYPAGLWSDSTKLVLCDYNNSRVLIWNSMPATNFTPADLVLGQNDFWHSMSNDDDQDGSPDSKASGRTMAAPYFVTSNGTILFVADSWNNRVLVWETFPTSNFASADKVIGQATFTADILNDDDQNGSTDAAPSARTLSHLSGLYFYGRQLFVSDRGNSRILIFNF